MNNKQTNKPHLVGAYVRPIHYGPIKVSTVNSGDQSTVCHNTKDEMLRKKNQQPHPAQATKRASQRQRSRGGQEYIQNNHIVVTDK
jgi:hypothetical protein